MEAVTVKLGRWARSVSERTHQVRVRGRRIRVRSRTLVNQMAFEDFEISTPATLPSVPSSSLIRAAHPADPGAVEATEGAIAMMFPELSELTTEEVDGAIEDVRKRD